MSELYTQPTVSSRNVLLNPAWSQTGGDFALTGDNCGKANDTDFPSYNILDNVTIKLDAHLASQYNTLTSYNTGYYVEISSNNIEVAVSSPGGGDFVGSGTLIMSANSDPQVVSLEITNQQQQTLTFQQTQSNAQYSVNYELDGSAKFSMSSLSGISVQDLQGQQIQGYVYVYDATINRSILKIKPDTATYTINEDCRA
ncbi:MAG: hypothetical protein Q8Q33_02360 [Chlamydiota bacterium]|nr:hypothetical protein [Chlamydiota bacterium]